MKRDIPIITHIRALYRLSKPMRTTWRAVKKNREKDLKWYFSSRQDGTGVLLLVRMQYNTELWRMQIDISDPQQIRMWGQPFRTDVQQVHNLERCLKSGGEKD